MITTSNYLLTRFIYTQFLFQASSFKAATDLKKHCIGLKSVSKHRYLKKYKKEEDLEAVFLLGQEFLVP